MAFCIPEKTAHGLSHWDIVCLAYTAVVNNIADFKADLESTTDPEYACKLKEDIAWSKEARDDLYDLMKSQHFRKDGEEQ